MGEEAVKPKRISRQYELSIATFLFLKAFGRIL